MNYTNSDSASYRSQKDSDIALETGSNCKYLTCSAIETIASYDISISGKSFSFRENWQHQVLESAPWSSVINKNKQMKG